MEVNDLVLVRDYIARNHEFADEGDGHQLELFCRGTLLAEEIPANGPPPVTWQVGVEWLTLSDLNGARLYPRLPTNSSTGVVCNSVTSTEWLAAIGS